MNIHFLDAYRNNFYKSPFAKEGKKQDKENTQTINKIEIQREQNGTKGHAMKRLFKQIEQLQESIMRVKENEKMPPEEKSKEVRELEKQIQELQKQMTQLREQEQKEKIEKAEEKREEKRLESLSEKEKEQEVQKLEQKSLLNVASANSHTKAASPHYFKASSYRKLAQMGMGSKYGGNRSVQEVSGLFRKAEYYENHMMKELTTANKLAKSAGKAIEEYLKHKKTSDISKAEDKDFPIEDKKKRIVE